VLGGVAVAASVISLALPLTAVGAVPAWADTSAPPSLCQGADGSVLGPNVCVFNDSMSQGTIQADLDAIAAQQVPNQFGSQRYAVLFEPGTYGTSTNPLNFQVGYYTEVAGLGATPNDVVINGSVDVYNQCFGPNDCIALDNFWRSVSNLTINVDTPNFGCYNGDFWAVSQAAPMAPGLLFVNGFMTPRTTALHLPSPATLHRRLRDERVDGGQRVAAAVPRPQQQPRRLEQRRLEPSLFRR
jgi:hypothetical protein